MRMLTGMVPEPFMVPELRDRVACMLNYFLTSIAGPKMSDLKVTAPPPSQPPRPRLYSLPPSYSLSPIAGPKMSDLKVAPPPHRLRPPRLVKP